MIIQASITGLFKTLLIIIGVFVVVRFLGQLMIAKRNMEEERQLNQRQRNFDKERKEKFKNFGRTKIVEKSGVSGDRVEDVDYEELE